MRTLYLILYVTQSVICGPKKVDKCYDDELRSALPDKLFSKLSVVKKKS